MLLGFDNSSPAFQNGSNSFTFRWREPSRGNSLQYRVHGGSNLASGRHRCEPELRGRFSSGCEQAIHAQAQGYRIPLQGHQGALFRNGFAVTVEHVLQRDGGLISTPFRPTATAPVPWFKRFPTHVVHSPPFIGET